MPANTPIYGFPYPLSTDLVANYPALGQELAQDIEAVLPTVGGLALVASQSFTSASTVSINNCFTSTYAHYRIVILVTASSASIVYGRMRAAGTDNTSANYHFQNINGQASTAGAARGSSQTFLVFGNPNSAASWASSDIFQPQLAAPTFYVCATGDSTTSPRNWQYTGAHNVSTAYDGISFVSDTGNITGNVRIYGYRNA